MNIIIIAALSLSIAYFAIAFIATVHDRIAARFAPISTLKIVGVRKFPLLNIEESFSEIGGVCLDKKKIATVSFLEDRDLEGLNTFAPCHLTIYLAGETLEMICEAKCIDSTDKTAKFELRKEFLIAPAKPVAAATFQPIRPLPVVQSSFVHRCLGIRPLRNEIKRRGLAVKCQEAYGKTWSRCTQNQLIAVLEG